LGPGHLEADVMQTASHQEALAPLPSFMRPLGLVLLGFGAAANGALASNIFHAVLAVVSTLGGGVIAYSSWLNAQTNRRNQAERDRADRAEDRARIAEQRATIAEGAVRAMKSRWARHTLREPED
jgi:uncharacterized membrane protein YebE (DUF533 family)